ncbi:septum formation inhibitor Maf, partial [Pseudomonas prosekii]
MLPLLLASSSVYRRELLARLQLDFTCSSPDIDESHGENESAINLVKRLAEQKARALAHSHPAHLIIGSDQVAVLGERIIGKPHTFEKAREQLLASSGASVTFLTGLALLNSQTGGCQVDCVPFTVHMRVLDQQRIERYLRAEQPYDCAGSFKAEGLGVSLFQSTDGPDATSLIGLPL